MHTETIAGYRVSVWDAINVAHDCVRAERASLPVALIVDGSGRTVASSDDHETLEAAREWARAEILEGRTR